MSDNRSFYIWDIVKAICVLAAVGVVVVKIYLTPLELKIDFSMLLSLLLALFSVAIAVLFYFKATETSNTFYDNTYKFTMDIAQLLAKIESGFGERLRHLDEGYSSMRSYFQSSGGREFSGEMEEAREKLKEDKLEVEKIIEERNSIVKDLMDRARLEQEEREKISNELQSKENELASLQAEVHRLKRNMLIERVKRRVPASKWEGEAVGEFTKNNVIDRLGIEVINKFPVHLIKRRFDRIKDELPARYIRDLEDRGLYSDGLTDEGALYIKRIASSLGGSV